MRIARFTTGDDPRYGIVEGEAGEEKVAVVAGDPLYSELTRTGETIALGDVRLLAPVMPRSKVVAIGKNYAEHAQEMGGEPPTAPLVFLKPNTAVIGPDDPIVMPSFSQEVHYEGELAVVIGRICKDVPLERVAEVVLGYTCANDVTARDAQRTDGQWARAKGFDTSCPLGPWIETDLDPATSLTTRLRRRDCARTAGPRDLIFDVRDVRRLRVRRVHPAAGRRDPDRDARGCRPDRAGQRVEVEIEGIGQLSATRCVRR